MPKKKPKTDSVDVVAYRTVLETKLRELAEANAKLDRIREAVNRLSEWSPEGTPEHFTKNYGYSKGDEDAPFFSEAFLYVLLGKEDARTILALMRPVFENVGMDL